jgi:cytochrome c-type biogenesis protein CcmF
MTIGPYTILCQNFDATANDNYQSARATLEIFRGGKSQMMLYPERRFFPASGETETMVAIRTSPLQDLYVVYAGRSPESGNPVIHAFLNPLVKWIWFGGIVVVLGTGLAMLPNRRTALVLSSVPEKSWDGAVAAAAPMPSVAAVTRRADAHD